MKPKLSSNPAVQVSDTTMLNRITYAGFQRSQQPITTCHLSELQTTNYKPQISNPKLP